MTLASPSSTSAIARRSSRLAQRPVPPVAGRLALASLSLGVLLTGCDDAVEVVRGAGSIVQEKRVLRPIDKIRIDGDFDVLIEIADGAPLELVANRLAKRMGEPEVEAAAEGVLSTMFGDPETIVWVEGPEDLLAYVRTEFHRDELRIGLRSGLRLDPMPTIEIRTRALRSLSSNGSGSIKLVTARRGDDPLEALVLSCHGAGDIEAVGRVRHLEVIQHGSGDVRLMELQAQDVDHSSVGSGDAYFFVDRSLKTSLVGSGDVVVKGAPKLDQRVRGSGEVRVVDERVRPTRGSSPR